MGYRRPRAHGIVDVSECVVAERALEDAFPMVRAEILRRGLHSGEVRMVAGEEGVSGLIVTGTQTTGFGPPRVTVQMGPARIDVGPRDFLQGNTVVAEGLQRAVKALAEPACEGEVAVELFAGSGALTAPLLELGYTVHAYEVDDRVSAAFRKVTAPLGRAHFHPCDLFGRGRPVPTPERVDLILLDPPRTGAAEVVPWIASSGATRVIMVACDVATALRDSRALMDRGFQCESVMSFDMFPNTAHQELVIALRR